MNKTNQQELIGEKKIQDLITAEQKVVRNGYQPEREIPTGIGPIQIKQPRVDDRVIPTEERFTSKILPRYMRRFPSIDNLIPTLYLKGVLVEENAA